MTRSLNISKSSSAAAQSMQTVASSGGLGEVWKVNYPFDNRMSKKILWLFTYRQLSSILLPL